MNKREVKHNIKEFIYLTVMMLIFYFKTGMGPSTWQWWMMIVLFSIVGLLIDISVAIQIMGQRGDKE